MQRPRLPRPSMVMLPSGVTLLNLFFGIFAIVAAARGDFGRAVLYVLIGAIADAIDGRVAQPGERVAPGAAVAVDGAPVGAQDEPPRQRGQDMRRRLANIVVAGEQHGQFVAVRRIDRDRDQGDDICRHVQALRKMAGRSAAAKTPRWGRISSTQ